MSPPLWFSSFMSSSFSLRLSWSGRPCHLEAMSHMCSPCRRAARALLPKIEAVSAARALFSRMSMSFSLRRRCRGSSCTLPASHSCRPCRRAARAPKIAALSPPLWSVSLRSSSFSLRRSLSGRLCIAPASHMCSVCVRGGRARGRCEARRDSELYTFSARFSAMGDTILASSPWFSIVSRYDDSLPACLWSLLRPENPYPREKSCCSRAAPACLSCTAAPR
mmetsp:Transcript_8596/g.21490  ORF Transcript_8596/g.21490 Transcript_8596/m.21490 type:complete len:222 (-) Transcript_8596:251-916(-)